MTVRFRSLLLILALAALALLPVVLAWLGVIDTTGGRFLALPV